jgi:hypothetical protein
MQRAPGGGLSQGPDDGDDAGPAQRGQTVRRCQPAQQPVVSVVLPTQKNMGRTGHCAVQAQQFKRLSHP